jgi:mannose-6-phosphate isomerase-like protein (cupin superfamily)
LKEEAMSHRIRILLLSSLVGVAALTPWQAVGQAAQAGLAGRIAHTNPAAFRPSPAVHGGAGTMSFTALLNGGAVTPEFNFLHRGEIPPGAGIGHHFHNTVEEMFVILDGEAQFTIDGRTSLIKGPAGVICRTGHAHAIYNSGTKPVQWVNLNVSLNAGVYDNFDLGDTRAGATLDPIPTFMVGRFDRDLLLRQGARGGRGAAATAAPAAPTTVLTRRALGPAVFSTTWAYIDQVLVPQGMSTMEMKHDTVGEAYLVLAGSGTVTVKGATSETAPFKTGDAIPIKIGESSLFTNTGSEPLELFVMGVAKDMAAKTQLLSAGRR